MDLGRREMTLFLPLYTKLFVNLKLKAESRDVEKLIELALSFFVVNGFKSVTKNNLYIV